MYNLDIMDGLTCPNCGCRDIESDPVRAHSVCTRCGTMVEQGMIVSDVTFMDSGGGGVCSWYFRLKGQEGW